VIGDGLRSSCQRLESLLGDGKAFCLHALPQDVKQGLVALGIARLDEGGGQRKARKAKGVERYDPVLVKRGGYTRPTRARSL